MYEYVTRGQAWLRKALMDFIENSGQVPIRPVGAKCAVIHVRQSDVIFHEELF
jgi:hypothetical protein